MVILPSILKDSSQCALLPPLNHVSSNNAASASSADNSSYTPTNTVWRSSPYISPYAPLNAAPQLLANIPRRPALNARWDSQGDALTLTRHRSGETTMEISKRLITAGYLATRAEVAASLERQDMDWGNQPMNV